MFHYGWSVWTDHAVTLVPCVRTAIKGCNPSHLSRLNTPETTLDVMGDLDSVININATCVAEITLTALLCHVHEDEKYRRFSESQGWGSKHVGVATQGAFPLTPRELMVKKK